MKKSILTVAFLLTMGLGTTVFAQEVPATEQPATEQSAPVTPEQTAPAGVAEVEEIGVSDIPKAITDAVLKEFPGATIKGAKLHKPTGLYMVAFLKADSTEGSAIYNASGEAQK